MLNLLCNYLIFYAIMFLESWFWTVYINITKFLTTEKQTLADTGDDPIVAGGQPPHPDLIPGLPNEISAAILSLVPYSHHPRLKPTCKSWRHFLSSQTLIDLRRSSPNPNSRSHLLCVFLGDPRNSPPYLFDPESAAWCALPPLPRNPSFSGLGNFASVSVGQFLYVLGGYHLDGESFLGHPSASASTFRFDFATRRWDSLASMISPRGNFACTAGSDGIFVAGGGSRNYVFSAAGSRTSSAERYDIARDEWVALDDLPGFRAGCAGFLVRSRDRREFWVMGDYKYTRLIDGILPVHEYHRDAVVMDLGHDGAGRWREVGDMWEELERLSLGKVAIVEDDEFCVPKVFMLHNDEIFRYDMDTNRWQKESILPFTICSAVVGVDDSCSSCYNHLHPCRYDMDTYRWRKGSILPRKGDSSHGFVVLNRELYVLTSLEGVESIETRRTRLSNKLGTLFFQIYNPESKVWRFLATKPPFHHLDFRTAVLCNIRL